MSEEFKASTGMNHTFRMVWGFLSLAACGWIAYGITTASQVATELTATPIAGGDASTEAARNAGVAIGASAGMSIFLCTGLPFLLFFLFLYWRNGVAIAKKKAHAEQMNMLNTIAKNKNG